MSNRIIKFRAWDAETQSMYPHEILVNDQWKVEEICNPMGDISVMQFTGLKDKNGKEIYEGDVFISDKGNWIVKNGAWDFWCEKKLNQMYGWYGECVTLEGKAPGQLPLYAEHIEIIGNIYENPELLNVK